MTWTDWIKENISSIAGVIIFVIVLAGVAYLLYGILGEFREGAYSLSALAISGVILLLGALLVFTTLVNALGLSTRDQALGLPEGSVRALLALALLGLFAILVSSVLNPKSEPRTVKGLREGDVTAFVRNNPDASDIVQRQVGDSPPTFDVTFHSVPRQDDFGKQMLTLVGTLMTSVISFYFGSAVVRAAGDGGGSSAPDVAAPQIRTSTGGTTATANTATDFTITGRGLRGVTQVEARGSTGAPVAATNVRVVNDRQVTCTFSLPADRWTISVIRSGNLPPVDVSPEIVVT